MTSDNELQRQLDRPEVPLELEQSIRANWQDQKANTSNIFAANFRVIAAGFAGMAVGVLLMNYVLAPSDLISVAFKDIQNHSNQQIGIALPIDPLLRRIRINPPPESMPIKMTKLCKLDGNKSLHLEVAGEKRGTVHLFIKQDNFDAFFGSAELGARATMNWKLIKPRSDLSVLVLYTQDMNPVNVDKLIQTMFFA